MHGISHAEIVDVIIQTVKIPIAAERRCAGNGITVIIVCQCHTGHSVILLVGRFIICRIAKQYTVLMVAEPAGGNGDIVRCALEIEQLVPIVGSERGGFDLGMTFHIAMVNPEIPAVCKFPDIISVQLRVMGAVDVAEDDIVSRAVICIIGTEINIIE